MSAINLKKLVFSPNSNPLMDCAYVPIKRSRVRAALGRNIEVDGGKYQAVIQRIEEKDQEQFVKVYSDGIAESYELSRTGHRVFQAILQEYENTPMVGGYVEAIILSWFGGGLRGRDVGMSEKTFQRGLKELLTKGFISPKEPNIYWVNPALFFKGDRVLFIREYQRRRQLPETAPPCLS